MAKLDGKIALITGGTTGIGAATAKLFQAEGATVIVTGSSAKTVETARKDLPGIEVIVSDQANTAASKALVDQMKAKHGRIDVLFVNAGIEPSGPSKVWMRRLSTASSMSMCAAHFS
jgi:NAD(P)-dependent dehydrogenase (short-subunit alcohol dehydrogenase family)